MEPPQESDCCNSGCNPCILDVYEAQLKKYKSLKNTPENHINAISLTSYTKFKLTEQTEIGDNVFLLQFVYCDTKPHSPDCFNYEPGQYILLRAKDYKGEFTRAYTPIPLSENSLGFVILVRIYQNGRMSTILKKLQIGAITSWRGPYGDIKVSLNYRFLFFIAQGTGIAPIFSVIHDLIVTKNEDCESFINLFFCCKNSKDILLRDQLYAFKDNWNFTCEMFLSEADNLELKYNEVVHDRKLAILDVEKYINGKNEIQAIICGSEKFGLTLREQLLSLGIQSSQIVLF